jgi:hypothetical protein
MANQGRGDLDPNRQSLAFEQLVGDFPPFEEGATDRPSKSGRGPAAGGQARASTQETAPGGVDQKIDLLTEQLRAATELLGAVRAENERLGGELKTAMASTGKQLHEGLTRVSQRLAEENGNLRAELRKALAQAGKQRADDRDELRTELKTLIGQSGDRSRSALAQLNHRVEELLGAVVRANARRADGPEVASEHVPAPIEAALAQASDHRAAEREQLRAELQSALSESWERMRAALVQLNQRLEELPEAVARATPRPTDGHEELVALLQSVLEQDSARTRSALHDEAQGTVAPLQAALVEARGQESEERQQLRTELQSALTQSWERMRSALVQLHQRFEDLPAAVVQASSQAPRADGSEQLLAALHGALEQHAIRTRLALAEEGSALRGELQSALTQLNARLDALAAAVAAASEPQGERPEDVVARLQASFAQASERRALERKSQVADLVAAFGTLTDGMTHDRNELRLLIASTVSGANQWFVRVRDELYQRLDGIAGLTAEASASTAAVQTLQRDVYEAQQAVWHLGDAVSQLREDIEQWQQKQAASTSARRPAAPAAATRAVTSKKAAPTKKAVTSKKAASAKRPVRAAKAPPRAIRSTKAR